MLHLTSTLFEVLGRHDTFTQWCNPCTVSAEVFVYITHEITNFTNSVNISLPMENKSPATKKRPQIIDEDYKQSCYILSKEGEKKKTGGNTSKQCFFWHFHIKDYLISSQFILIPS